MKTKYISIIALTGLVSLASCVEDKGSYDYKNINEITVTGLQDKNNPYTVMAGVTELVIEPTVTGSVLGNDDSQYEYTWYTCNGEHTHTILGHEKDLHSIVNLAPATYELYLIINDTSTGQEWIISDMALSVGTPLSTGFYILGEKEDGTVGMDFLSMPTTEGDTTVVKDIFTNSMQLRGAKDLIYTGYTGRSNAVINLWMITEDGAYKIENSIQEQSVFDVDLTFNESFTFPSPMIEHPAKVVDQIPHQAAGGQAIRDQYRGYVTEDGIFAGDITSGETFKNPVNRYSQTSMELFTPYKNLFYTEEPTTTMGVRAFVVYDMDAEQFAALNGSSLSSVNYCRTLTDRTGDAFPWKQDGRTIVYGANSIYYSYAIMKDIDNEENFYLYRMYVTTYLSPTKLGAVSFTTADAPEFNQASFYAMSYEYPVVLYTVDNKLYMFNYETKQTQLLNTYDGEITYFTYDWKSAGPTRFIVCTYNEAAAPEERGTIYEYNVGQNLTLDPVMTGPELDKEFVYHTSLKIKKLEYRNSNL